MICEACRDGGQLARLGFSFGADECHQDCPGGTWCDCQHWIGQLKKGT
jgi:hypothetical protein